MKKAVILARVSTSRQEKEGMSLQNQLPILQNYARTQGFEIDQEFVFSETAGLKIRKKFEEMVDYIKKKSDVKIIIAYRVDRITRNFRDAVLIDELMKDHNKEVHFVDDRLVIDKNSTGRDMQDWDLKVFLAKQQLNRLSEDGKNSGIFKVQRGEWPGAAPFGYDNVLLENKKKWVVSNPFEANLVKYLFETYATGTVSFLTLTHKIKEEFGYKITTSKVDQILNRKFYTGVMQYGGLDYPHNYEQLITMSLFEKVQAVKNQNGQRGKGIKNGKLPFLYRGLIKCSECGSSITTERKKNKYHYYKCTQHYKKHNAEYVPEDDITEQISTVLDLVHMEQDELNRLLSVLNDSHEGQKALNRELLATYQGEYTKLTERVSKAYDYLFKGAIPEDDCSKKIDEYRSKQTVLQAKIDNLKKSDESFYRTIETILQVVTNAGNLFKSSGMDAKREILSLAFQNLELDGPNLIYEWSPLFEKVAYCIDHPKWYAR
jgi:site-specific DNA recombinase